MASCRRSQQGSARRKKFRSAVTASPEIDFREVGSVVSMGERGEPSSTAEAGSLIPGLDSGAGPAEAVAGASPASPPAGRPAKFPNYEMEDISEPAPFVNRQHLGGGAPNLRACTTAGPAKRGRVLSPPSQEEAPRVAPPAAPPVLAPAIHISDPYYWPIEVLPPTAPSQSASSDARFCTAVCCCDAVVASGCVFASHCASAAAGIYRVV